MKTITYSVSGKVDQDDLEAILRIVHQASANGEEVLLDGQSPQDYLKQLVTNNYGGVPLLTHKVAFRKMAILLESGINQFELTSQSDKGHGRILFVVSSEKMSFLVEYKRGRDRYIKTFSVPYGPEEAHTKHEFLYRLLRSLSESGEEQDNMIRAKKVIGWQDS